MEPCASVIAGPRYRGRPWLVRGCLIHFFEMQPFIVTLAGMFLARGLCYLVSIDSITISTPYTPAFLSIAYRLSRQLSLSKVGDCARRSGSGNLYRALHTIRTDGLRHRRNEQPAVLMGLPVGARRSLRTRSAAFAPPWRE